MDLMDVMDVMDMLDASPLGEADFYLIPPHFHNRDDLRDGRRVRLANLG